MPSSHLQSNPQDDLSVVMGRFHAWDALQKGDPDPHNDEVREVSYEEALAVRRPGRTATHAGLRNPMSGQAGQPADGYTEHFVSAGEAHRLGDLKHELKAATSPAFPRANPAKRQPAAGVHVSAAPPVRTQHRRTKSTAARSPKSVAPAQNSRTSTAGKAPEAAVTRGRRKLDSATSQKASRKSCKPSIGRAQPQTKTALGKPTASAVSSKSRGAQSSAASRSVEPGRAAAFRSALTECLKQNPQSAPLNLQKPSQESSGRSLKTRVGAHLNPGTNKPVLPRKEKAAIASGTTHKQQLAARTISVNLRLSQPEHARMRKAAAEGGVTLATYVRESTLACACELERETRAARERKLDPRSEEISRASHSAADGSLRRQLPENREAGLLARVKRFWFGRRLEVSA